MIRFILIFIFLISYGCLKRSETSDSANVVILNLSVNPIWEDANWNDYIKRSSLATFPDKCTGLESSSYPSPCIHSGEIRIVDIPSLAACDGFTMEDSLEAFEWDCTVVDTGIRFTSNLKSNFRLSELIDSDQLAWKDIYVILKQNALVVGRSEPSKWWTNTIKVLPDNSSSVLLTLDTVDDDSTGPDEVFSEGTIFIIPNNRSSFGYKLALQGGAVTMSNNVVLSSSNGAVHNCNSATGPVGTLDTFCLLLINSKFNWVDGTYYSTSTGIGFFLYESRFSTFSSSTLSPGHIKLENNSDSNRFLNNDMVGTLSIFGGSYNYFSRLWIHSSSEGVYVQGSASTNIKENVFYKLRVAAGPAAHSIHTRKTYQGLVFVDTIITGAGFRRHSNPGWGGDTHMVNLTGVNIAGGTFSSGIYFNNSSNYLTTHSVALSNLTHGIYFSSSASLSNSFSDLAFSNHSIGFKYTTTLANEIRYEGSILLGIASTSECDFTVSPTSPGMTVISGVPGAGACSITGQSTAIIDRSVTDFSDSFNGKQNDSQNASSVAGQSMFSVSMDFRNFENDYRLWSKSGGTFPNSDQRSSCIFAGETCQIWDFRVLPTDLKLFKNNATTFLLSSDTCPTDVAGDQTARTIKSPYNSMTTRIFKNAIEDAPSDGDGICEAGETCFQRYLKNAQEILGDFDADFSIIGDDDGLCESHEACLYSPYFGAYQGEGTFRACEFQDSQSEVTNVTLYGYQ